MLVSWVTTSLPARLPAELVVPTAPLRTALAASGGLPDAVLPAAQEHFVSWLSGRDTAERSAAIAESLREQGTVDLGQPWQLTLVIASGKRPLGVQRLVAGTQWPDRRTVYTSGWLLREVQGKGLGTAARAAVLDFAFQSCNAEAARSHVLDENYASRRISESLGYVPIGQKTVLEGDLELEDVYELSRSAWRG